MSDLNIVDKKAPVCCHMRSKGMYIHGTAELVETGMPGTGDGYCWCLKTMHVFGPDNTVVNREECRPGRQCYETI
jgi:hypothetical protein